MLFICFRIWPIPKPLRKIICFEESSFRFPEIVKRRGYHTLLYIVVYFFNRFKKYFMIANGGGRVIRQK